MHMPFWLKAILAEGLGFLGPEAHEFVVVWHRPCGHKLCVRWYFEGVLKTGPSLRISWGALWAIPGISDSAHF